MHMAKTVECLIDFHSQCSGMTCSDRDEGTAEFPKTAEIATENTKYFAPFPRGYIIRQIARLFLRRRRHFQVCHRSFLGCHRQPRRCPRYPGTVIGTSGAVSNTFGPIGDHSRSCALELSRDRSRSVVDDSVMSAAIPEVSPEVSATCFHVSPIPVADTCNQVVGT